MYLGQIVKVKQTENRNVDRAAHHQQNVIRFTQQLLTAHLSPLGDENIPTEVQCGHLNIMYLHIDMYAIMSSCIWNFMEL